MYYYSFHIGDYRAATAHLTNDEDLAYRRLLDWYYDNEQFIALSDTDRIARRIRVDVYVMERVLQDMFTLDENGNYRNTRADLEITAYHEKQQQASNAGKASAQRRMNARSTPVQQPFNAGTTDVQPTMNHEPLTNNQNREKKEKTTQRGSRLPIDFEMEDAWGEFCEQERPDLTPKKVFDGFKDFWIAKAGAGGVKLDWFATWRNWVRNQSQAKTATTFAQVKADIARTTVADSSDYEATKRREAAEALIPKNGPTLEVLARLAALRKPVTQS